MLFFFLPFGLVSVFFFLRVVSQRETVFQRIVYYTCMYRFGSTVQFVYILESRLCDSPSSICRTHINFGFQEARVALGYRLERLLRFSRA